MSICRHVGLFWPETNFSQLIFEKRIFDIWSEMNDGRWYYCLLIVEDPSYDFMRLRDYVDALRCRDLAVFSPENIRNGFSDRMVEQARKELKINKVTEMMWPLGRIWWLIWFSKEPLKRILIHLVTWCLLWPLYCILLVFFRWWGWLVGWFSAVIGRFSTAVIGYFDPPCFERLCPPVWCAAVWLSCCCVSWSIWHPCFWNFHIKWRHLETNKRMLEYHCMCHDE